jgi:ribosomal protein S18 acetylase RimI-like enzyme
VRIREAESVNAALVDAFARLLPQLSRSSPPPSEAELTEMVAASGTHVLLAEDDDGVVLGTLTLVTFRIPTGVRAWIEDVVVDEAGRGQGVGEALNSRALELARDAGAKTVDLTSRPSREAANRLYQRLGFTPRETNVWRFALE